MKDSKDPRAVHRKDHEKGANGLQTVLVPDGHGPGVGREKNEMKFYLSAAASPGPFLPEPGKPQFCFRRICERISLTLLLV